MEELGIKHNFTMYTHPVIITWYEHSNPLAEVGRIVVPAPHVDGAVSVATGLKTVVYTFKFFESADGVNLGTLISSWSLQVRQKSETIAFYDYIVGRGNSEADNTKPFWADPPANQSQLVDERLTDATYIRVFSSTGLRQPWEYNVLSTGGIELAIPGDQFQDTEKWTIVAVRVKDSDTTTQAVKVYDDIRVAVVSGEAFGADWYNKMNLAGFNVLVGETIFPAFNTIPNSTKAKFHTYTGTQRYWKLKFAAGNAVDFNGRSDYNEIYLGKNEEIELFFKDGKCYVLHYKGDYDKVGEYVLGNRQLLNTWIADGRSFAEQPFDLFPRLMAELPSELQVSYADYDLFQDVKVGEVTKRYYHNRAKFAVDNINRKFKFPDLRELTPKALKATDLSADATRLSPGAGGMQAQQLIKHKHGFKIAATNNPNGTLIYTRTVPESNVIGYTETEGGDYMAVDNYAQWPLVRI